MAALLGLWAAGVLVILLAVLAWWRANARRHSTVHNGITEQQARENAAPLTTAILSGSRNSQAQPKITNVSGPVQTVASDGVARSFFTHSANVVGELPRAGVARLLSAGPTSGGGQAVRVAREVEHARELSFSDRERTQGHVEFVGDLLSGERSNGRAGR